MTYLRRGASHCHVIVAARTVALVCVLHRRCCRPQVGSRRRRCCRRIIVVIIHGGTRRPSRVTAQWMKPSWCQAKTGPLEGVGPRSACGDPSFHLFLHSHLSCSCFSRATLPPFLLVCSGVRMRVNRSLYCSGDQDE